jgi:hypothetical protein
MQRKIVDALRVVTGSVNQTHSKVTNCRRIVTVPLTLWLRAITPSIQVCILPKEANTFEPVHELRNNPALFFVRKSSSLLLSLAIRPQTIRVKHSRIQV